MKAIYVDQLPVDATEEDLRPLLEPFGVVESVIIGADRELGEQKCFALIELDQTAAGDPIAAINGRELRGQTLVARESPQGTRQRTRPPPGHTAGGA